MTHNQTVCSFSVFWTGQTIRDKVHAIHIKCSNLAQSSLTNIILLYLNKLQRLKCSRTIQQVQIYMDNLLLFPTVSYTTRWCYSQTVILLRTGPLTLHQFRGSHSMLDCTCKGPDFKSGPYPILMWLLASHFAQAWN